MNKIVFYIFLSSLSFQMMACKKKDIPDVAFAAEMRNFIIDLSFHAKLTKSDFIVIPQNGAQLMSINEEDTNQPDFDYLAAIDGQGQEDLFFGYSKDDKASDLEFQNEIIPFLNIGIDNDISILVTDYCSSANNISTAINKNADRGYISFAATERELNTIPDLAIHNENDSAILKLADAKNFLYLINPNNYKVKTDFISTIDATNFDVFIIDFFDNDGNALSAADVEILQSKPNGEKRLVISYMSIGEAEDYRYYWSSDWEKRKTEPTWLYGENRNWKGNYKVFYWMADWQSIIFGNSEAYLDQIVATGFDGVYLDIVSAFEFFDEEKNK